VDIGGIIMSLEQYHRLSAEYDRFIYESYQVETIDEKLLLNYQYRLEGENQPPITFFHRVSYELVHELDEHLNLEQLNNLDALIFSIGLMEGINYYKSVCPKSYVIACGTIDVEQNKWWQKFFYHGLGELIYLNGMSEEVTESNLVHFVCDHTWPNIFEEIDLDLSGNLIPVGGGKDSVVTLELLKGMKEDNLCFVMSPPQAAIDCIHVAGYTNYLLAKRYIDKKILKMNDEGFLNGHVPFSAILGFIAVLGAALVGKRYIPLSNERSANESTVLGASFNHQYSKSYEFEKDFNEYVNRYLIRDIHYFSLLRPLYEIDIAERFAKHEAYHEVFRSCNRGKKDNSWCGHCSKCLFVYTILAPYMSEEALIRIFGYNLLDNKDLEPIFLELIGVKEVKPFECVGTIDEIRWSMKRIIEDLEEKNKSKPSLVKAFEQKILLDTIGPPNQFDEENDIPDYYLGLLEEKL